MCLIYIIIEPRCEKTKSDTNRAVQPQKMDRGLKFRIKIVEGLYYPYSKNKGADQLPSYREADLRLCLRICKKPVFLMTRLHCHQLDDNSLLQQQYGPVVRCISVFDVSLVRRKPDFCICENKDADQLRSNREADQRLCFRYTDSTIPLLPKYEISSL